MSPLLKPKHVSEEKRCRVYSRLDVRAHLQAPSTPSAGQSDNEAGLSSASPERRWCIRLLQPHA